MKWLRSNRRNKTSLDDIQQCELLDTEIIESESNPPQYYNESTIVKKLESSGVGRPSTYASIVSTLYSRNYTVVKDIEGKPKSRPYYKLNSSNKIVQGIHKTTTSKQKKRIVRDRFGSVLYVLPIHHFSDMICIGFTAQVERDLDLISEGTSDFTQLSKSL